MLLNIENKNKELKFLNGANMDKIDMVDRLDDVSSKLQGIISLANMRLNDLNNPNGSLSSEDKKSILYVTIQLLSYQYEDIRNIRDYLLLMDN